MAFDSDGGATAFSFSPTQKLAFVKDMNHECSVGGRGFREVPRDKEPWDVQRRWAQQWT